jgi:hypothetical protein
MSFSVQTNRWILQSLSVQPNSVYKWWTVGVFGIVRSTRSPCRRRNRRGRNIHAEPEIPRYKAVRRLVLELLLSVSRLRRGVLTCVLYLILCMCASPKFVTGGCSVDFRSTCPGRYDATFAIFFSVCQFLFD